MLQRLFICAFVIILVGCGDSKQPAMEAQEPAVARGFAAVNEASYRRHIATLASDEFGGRGPASPGEELTVNYLVAAFKSMGLAPANGDSYTQQVPLVSVEVTNQPALVIKGSGEPLVLNYHADQVVSSRRQMAGGELANSDMVFVGYGINAPERNWNDYDGVDVRGKTVVMFINDPGFATQDAELFNGNAMTYYGRWNYKFDEAARQGAAGAIIVHADKPAAYPWSTVQNSWKGPQFDIVRENKGADLSVVESWITEPSAVALFAKAGMDLQEQYLQAQKPGFRARPMRLTASATLVTETAQVTSKNVAALLQGSEAPDEIFVYMAHWDHLGTDPAIEGDGIYNGAYDNASGTAALLELAAAFSSLEQKPRRSVLFLAVAAEEQGLLGSSYYAAHPLYPLDKTVAGLNMDGMNVIGPTRDVTVVGYGFSELDAILAQEAAGQGRVLVADPEAEKGYYYRSDHFELAKLGVPMLYPNKGYDNVEKGVAYGRAMADDYTANHYHRVSDEYSESWNVAGALQDIELYYEVGYAIANDDGWPNWNEGSEFKSLRDAQRGVSVQQALAKAGRLAADITRDSRSKPDAVIPLLRLRGGERVADIFAGGGYYSELLASVVGSSGEVLLHNNTAYRNFAGDALAKRLSDREVGNITLHDHEADDLALGESNLDAALIVMSFHDLFYAEPESGWNAIDSDDFLAQIYRALKPGGRFLVVDHQAAAGSGSDAAQTLHRVEENFAQQTIEAAGFRLTGSTEALRNPGDDYSVLVFDPAVRGKTDRFVLVFEKPAQ